MPLLFPIDPQDVLNGPEAYGSEVFDCAVVGGGPAGLTAALYLRRFERRGRVIDAGAGRSRVAVHQGRQAFVTMMTGKHIASAWPWAMRPSPRRRSTTAFDAMREPGGSH